MGDCLGAEGIFMKMDDDAAHQEPRIFRKLQRHSAPKLTRLMVSTLPSSDQSHSTTQSAPGSRTTKMRNRTAFEKAFRIVKVRSQLRC